MLHWISLTYAWTSKRMLCCLFELQVPEILPVLLSDIPRMLRQGFDTMNWEEGHVSEVEKWLNTQAPASVIYLSFGSLVTLPEKQIGTLTLALEAAGYPFVWVYRPPGIPQVGRQTTSNSSTVQYDDCFPPGEISSLIEFSTSFGNLPLKIQRFSSYPTSKM